MRYALVLVAALAMVSLACNNQKPNQTNTAADPTLPATASPTGTATGDTYAPTPTPSVATKPPLKEAPVPTPGAKASGNTYTIKAHDTFFSIAREQFNGDMKKAKEIQALNPDLDPAKLPIGKTIKLPEK